MKHPKKKIKYLIDLDTDMQITKEADILDAIKSNLEYEVVYEENGKEHKDLLSELELIDERVLLNGKIINIKIQLRLKEPEESKALHDEAAGIEAAINTLQKKLDRGDYSYKSSPEEGYFTEENINEQIRDLKHALKTIKKEITKCKKIKK
jgi:hypothetical protein